MAGFNLGLEFHGLLCILHCSVRIGREEQLRHLLVGPTERCAPSLNAPDGCLVSDPGFRFAPEHLKAKGAKVQALEVAGVSFQRIVEIGDGLQVIINIVFVITPKIMIRRGTCRIGPDRGPHLLQKEDVLADGVVGDPERFVKRGRIQPQLFCRAEGQHGLDEIALMKTGNASPVMQNRIAGLFRKASQHCIEHFVPSPLVYQSSKGMWRDQPFELKAGQVPGSFQKPRVCSAPDKRKHK